jgi:predicted Zn-dependent protease
VLRAFASLAIALAMTGCSGAQNGEGPGHREQPLALMPSDELEIGREAYADILSHATVIEGGPQVERVQRVGERIAKAARIEPLQREINLRLAGYSFEWEYNVIEDEHVNAFCLPGGKIGVFSGLLKVVESDDQLAAVIAHEVAHALAHHASERIARERSRNHGLLRDLSYNRQQELEADHIGIFLMTFAGYDPEEAVRFWKEMEASRSRGLRLPEILSDHPSDARRMEQLAAWVEPARSAKRAYDEGRIAPSARTRK